eukprot:TRINITY_DN53135_c0_g2_i1.p1 TRINITY_DN53135_c0_g2~~TRINITY_DN53135_c0_g2_i1.p1  ORF type:complete len:188 (-),score=23.69 TRINITY_DN53135_c0_g2_i1:529-1017(-)
MTMLYNLQGMDQFGWKELPYNYTFGMGEANVPNMVACGPLWFSTFNATTRLSSVYMIVPTEYSSKIELVLELEDDHVGFNSTVTLTCVDPDTNKLIITVGAPVIQKMWWTKGMGKYPTLHPNTPPTYPADVQGGPGQFVFDPYTSTLLYSVGCSLYTTKLID